MNTVNRVNHAMPFIHNYRAVMYHKRWIEYIITPVIGFFPFFLYALLRITLEQEFLPLVIAFTAAMTGQVCFYLSPNTRVLSTTFIISGLALLATSVIWAFTQNYHNNRNFYIIICEIILVIICKLVLISKKYVNLYIFKRRSIKLRALLDNLYFSISIIQPILVLHLFCILISMFFVRPGSYHTTLSFYLYSIIPISIVILTYIIYELFRANAFVARFKKEEWLPIISEKGEVTGKIAKSVSLNMKNKFMHPVVRIALICNKQLYLQKRNSKNHIDPGKFDYPFEKYVLFNHQINIAVKNSVAQLLGTQHELSFKFLLKYTFENEETKRLNFLYVISIDDESSLPANHKLKGKFWTVKQIEESFADNIFSECFELEFEYIKNKFLIAKEEYAEEMY